VSPTRSDRPSYSNPPGPSEPNNQSKLLACQEAGTPMAATATDHGVRATARCPVLAPINSEHPDPRALVEPQSALLHPALPRTASAASARVEPSAAAFVDFFDSLPPSTFGAVRHHQEVRNIELHTRGSFPSPKELLSAAAITSPSSSRRRNLTVSVRPCQW
jgi:hypothetical protein